MQESETSPHTPFYKRPVSRRAWWLSIVLFWSTALLTDSVTGLILFGVACILCVAVRHGRANALGLHKLSIISLLLPAVWLGLILCVSNDPYHRDVEWMQLVGLALLILLFVNGGFNGFVAGRVPVRSIIPMRQVLQLALLIPSVCLFFSIHFPVESTWLPYEEDPELHVREFQKPDEFAFDVFRDLAEESAGNITFSPAGLETTLLQLREAARGTTRDAIDRLAMGAPGIPSATRTRFASAIFADATLRLKPGAPEVVRVPFSRNAGTAAASINRWSESHTKDRIWDIIHEADITPETRLIAVNSIYLDEHWLRPFEKDMTQDGEFRPGGCLIYTTKMMQQRGHFLTAEGEDWRAVALFYRTDGRPGEPACFIGILPKGETDIREFAATLTAQKYNEIRRALANADLHGAEKTIVLPRMYLQPEKLPLERILRKHGLGGIFEQTADFSGLTDEPIWVTEMMQSSYVRVAELGTEAGSTTSAIATLSAYDPDEFRFDRPFIWAIGDLTTDAPPYFLGLFEAP